MRNMRRLADNKARLKGNFSVTDSKGPGSVRVVYNLPCVLSMFWKMQYRPGQNPDADKTLQKAHLLFRLFYRSISVLSIIILILSIPVIFFILYSIGK
jgi:hypothetical protein